MKTTILTYGSRGDVQPFLALAVGLQKRGHQVRLAAPHRFASFVGEYGVAFVPLAGDPEIISQRLNLAGTNPIQMVHSISSYIFEIAPQVSRSAFIACEGSDLLVHSFLFTVGAHSWAFQHGIPDMSVQTFPMFAPTRAFPNPAFANVPPGILSYFSHWFASQIFWYGGNLGYGPARCANRDIPYPSKLYRPFKDSPHHLRTPLLFAFSPQVLPRPGEWDENVHVTGYFLLKAPNDFQPPDSLKDFLSNGRPPICVTFGSMIHREAETIYRIVLEALAHTKNRAVILSGWSDIHDVPLPDHVLSVDAVPHDWLLPRCKAIIHHGGAGTTAAGLRSGIPNIVVPFAGDQPFWGSRVQAIGVGPRPIQVKRLTFERLVAALIEANGDTVRSAAKLVGERIRAEDGVGMAIDLIEQHVEKR